MFLSDVPLSTTQDIKYGSMGSATHLHGHADKLLVHLLRWCVVLV
eukprot:COSAG05_NODE_1739_length_4161_cov_4.587642_1_plen_44_part_10